MTKIISLLGVAVLIAACGETQHKTDNTNQTGKNNPAEVSRAGQPEPSPSKEPTTASANTACHEITVAKKAVLKSQTFAIDFEPFKGSCFVTTHDPEYKDPPLESEIAIYRDGKSVFAFPDQFNGVTVGCWVEAVGFQDVNNDNRTDIIVVGKCSGKSDSFNENSIYINDGKSFFTRPDANNEVADLRTVKDVAAFARANPEQFSNANNASDSNSKP